MKGQTAMVTVLLIGGVVAAAAVGGYIWFNRGKDTTAPSTSPDQEHFGSQYEHGSVPAEKPVVKPAPKMRYNPLRLTKGKQVSVDDGDLSGVVFNCSEVQSYDEVVGGASYPFTDYLLISQSQQVENEFASPEDGRIYIRLRAIRPEHDVDGGVPELMVYWLQESRPFDKGWIEERIFQTKGKFVLPGLINDEESAEFVCLDPTPEPHSATMVWFRDDNGDGELTDQESISSAIEYWAFRRSVVYEGEEFDQYVVVQVNQNTGVIDILVGWAVGVKSIRIS